MYFDHGVYISTWWTSVRSSCVSFRTCHAAGPLWKKKKPWDGKRVGMENLLKIELKIGAHAIKLPIFWGFLFFFSFEKNIELLVQNWWFTPYWFLDLSGFLGGFRIFFRKSVETMERIPTSTIYQKVIPSRIQRLCGPKTRCYLFLKWPKTFLPIQTKKSTVSHKYTTQKVPSLKLT